MRREIAPGSSLTSSLLQLWRLAPPRMRRVILKGLAFRMVQAFCLAGVFGIVAVWSLAFAEGSFTSPGTIAATCLAIAVLLFLQFLFAYWSVGCIWLTSFRLVGAIRHRLLKRMVDLPMVFHLARPKGELANALTSDLALIENLLTDGLPRLVHSLFLPLFVLLIIAALDKVAAAFAILLVLVALPLLFLSCRRLAGLSNEKQRAQAHATSQVLQWVEGIATVRIFGMLDVSQDGYTAPLADIHRISVRMVASLTAPLLGFAAIVISGLAVVVAVVGYRHEIDALSAGRSAAILSLSLPLYAPLLGLAPFLELAAVAQGAIDRLNAIILAQPEHRRARRTPSGYAVACEGAAFRYAPAAWAVKPVTFELPERGLTAIVGPSGAGKSTLLQLLAGLLQPTEGRVLIGGVDIADMAPDELNRLVSVVFQDVFLFSGSIRDNIAMGNPDATHAGIEMAARAASAHDFIKTLPDGYETRIGDNGLALSGGERQRISLARAILKAAPIVLVDEGTASVDNLAAQEIVSALKELARDRAVVVVTHSLSSLGKVDQIVDLGQG